MREETYDDRTLPLLLAMASTRDAMKWNEGDAVEVINALLAEIDELRLGRI